MATGPIDAVVAIHNAFRRDMAPQLVHTAIGGDWTELTRRVRGLAECS